MPGKKQSIVNKVPIIILLGLGIALIIGSTFYASSFLAILGLALVFWGIILSYVTPEKQVPLILLNASADTNYDNIERILTEFNLTEKGIYLPPRNLVNIESSLIFIPQQPNATLPKPEETTEKLISSQRNGLFLSPPGLALSRLLENEFGKSFTKTDLFHLQILLPKLLIENIEIAENVDVQIEEKTITINISGNLLNSACQEISDKQRAHTQVGCLLSSALACVLAKATGKPIVIQKESLIPKTRTTTIEYRITEE